MAASGQSEQATLGASAAIWSKCSPAPFERCFEIFLFHGPRTVVSRTLLDYFDFCVGQIRQHISGLVTDVLGAQVTGHMVVHSAGAGLEILVKLSVRRQFREKFHRVHGLGATFLASSVPSPNISRRPSCKQGKTVLPVFYCEVGIASDSMRKKRNSASKPRELL